MHHAPHTPPRSSGTSFIPGLAALLGLSVGLGWALPQLLGDDRPPPPPATSDAPAVALVYATTTSGLYDFESATYAGDIPAPTGVPPTEVLPTATPAATWTPPPEAFVPVLPTIDAALKDRLRAVHALGLSRGLRPDVFMKVGDSISVSGQFLTDFGCGLGDLGAFADLAPTVAYFSGAEVPPSASYARCGASNSFTRRSAATGIGWSAVQVLVSYDRIEARATARAERLAAAQGVTGTAGTPVTLATGGDVAATSDTAATDASAPVSPTLVTEALAATGPADPAAAVTGTGTAALPGVVEPGATLSPPPAQIRPPECQPPDDTPLRCELKLTRASIALIMFGTNDLAGRIAPADFKANMAGIVQALLAEGVIPVVSTIPPRTDRASADARVSAYNVAVMELAAEMQVPLWNYWAALNGPEMVRRGMAWDGIHPEAFANGSALTPAGLRYGQNQRNLGALQVLDKLRRIVVEDGAPE